MYVVGIVNHHMRIYAPYTSIYGILTYRYPVMFGVIKYIANMDFLGENVSKYISTMGDHFFPACFFCIFLLCFNGSRTTISSYLQMSNAAEGPKAIARYFHTLRQHQLGPPDVQDTQWMCIPASQLDPGS